MRKQENTKTIYKPNEGVKITVDNKPVIDKDTGEIYMYEVSVGLKVKKYETDKPLRFKTDEDLVDYIHNIDLDDHNPQASFLGDGENGEVVTLKEADSETK